MSYDLGVVDSLQQLLWDGCDSAVNIDEHGWGADQQVYVVDVKSGQEGDLRTRICWTAGAGWMQSPTTWTGNYVDCELETTNQKTFSLRRDMDCIGPEADSTDCKLYRCEGYPKYTEREIGFLTERCKVSGLKGTITEASGGSCERLCWGVELGTNETCTSFGKLAERGRTIPIRDLIRQQIE